MKQHEWEYENGYGQGECCGSCKHMFWCDEENTHHCRKNPAEKSEYQEETDAILYRETWPVMYCKLFELDLDKAP